MTHPASERKKPVCYVLSYGGSGSNMLNYYLANSLGLKAFHVHIRFPFPTVPPSSRIIFIYSNPVHAVISLFSRFPAAAIYQNLESSQQGPKSLDQYAAEGKDTIELESYFMNHISPTHPRNYQVLFIKYEFIWDNLDLLEQFIGYPGIKKHFPEKVARHPYNVKKETIAKLEKIYEKLISKQNELPSFWIN